MHLYDNKSLRVSRAMGTQQTITASALTHEQKTMFHCASGENTRPATTIMNCKKRQTALSKGL